MSHFEFPCASFAQLNIKVDEPHLHIIQECFNRGLLSKDEYNALSIKTPFLDDVVEIFESNENVEILGYCFYLFSQCDIKQVQIKIPAALLKKLAMISSKNVDALDLLSLKILSEIDTISSAISEYTAFLSYVTKKLGKYAEGQDILFGSLYESSKKCGIFFEYVKSSLVWANFIAHNICISKHQIQYYMVFFLWKLSFQREDFLYYISHNTLLRELCKLLEMDTKSKVQRLLIALLKNFSRFGNRFVAQLLRYQVQDTLENLGKEDADSEETEDIMDLKEKLTKAILTLSNFDEYYAELQSGDLEWTPYHKSALFWKNNALRMEEKGGECLKLLLNFMQTSRSSKTLLICLNDIQNYLSVRPNSSKNLLELGLKNCLVSILEFPDDEVKYQAVISLQKFLCTGLQ